MQIWNLVRASRSLEQCKPTETNARCRCGLCRWLDWSSDFLNPCLRRTLPRRNGLREFRGLLHGGLFLIRPYPVDCLTRATRNGVQLD
jgi:hypothetical protein